MEQDRPNPGPGARGLALAIGLAGLMLAGSLISLQPVEAEWLPPLPPFSTPGPTPLPGGAIELLVNFPATWPWDYVHWQELWTVVQWQDHKDVWHDVAGWQGTLHEIASSDDGSVVGSKPWWVGREDLGKGPFRWRIYRRRYGWLMATSEPFYLPEHSRGTTTVEVDLSW